MNLTIAIAVYNGEKYLSQMVDSILNQSFHDYELLLLDDGSTDGSGALCDAYAKNDSRVRVIHKENAGLCASRNLAIRLAKGSHICFPDQDDRLLPGMLEMFVQSLSRQNADFTLCGYQVRVENAAGELIELRPVCAPDIWLDGTEHVRRFYLQHLGDGVVAPVWNIVYSLEFLRGHQLQFDESLRMSLDDLAFHAQAFFAAERVQVLSGFGIEYYVRAAASSSRKYNPNFQSQCLQVLARLREQLIASGLTASEELVFFYRLTFRLYVVSGLQNLVYARGTLGKEQVTNSIRLLLADPLSEETVAALANGSGLSRFERLVLKIVQKKRIRRLYQMIICKDWVRGSRLLTAAKRITS